MSFRLIAAYVLGALPGSRLLATSLLRGGAITGSSATPRSGPAGALALKRKSCTPGSVHPQISPLGKKSLLIATVLGGSLLSVPASAHLGHTITRAERYLKIDASEGDTRVVVSLTLGAEEGMQMLESADTNQDGSVSQAEADAHLHAWGEGLREELPIEVNGARVEVVWTDAFFDPMGEVRPLPVTLEMVAHVPVETREATIVVRDAMVRREIFERTDVGFQAHDGAELVLSGSGDAPLSDRHMALSFGPSAGEAMPGSIAASFHYPNRSEAVAWHVPAMGAFGVAVLAALGWLARRRASRS